MNMVTQLCSLRAQKGSALARVITHGGETSDLTDRLNKSEEVQTRGND